MKMPQKQIIDTTRLNRDSNVELIRIVSIFIILLHHFCVHALYPEVLSTDLIGKDWDSHLLLFIHGFLFIGVNCFVLISGYYRIKPKLKSFLNLYLTYAFYNLLHPLTFIINSFLQGEGFALPYPTSSLIVRTLLPFSHGHLWFMDCYLALFFLSPLLNAAISFFNQKQHIVCLILLTILNLYFGGIMGMARINSDGFSVSNFVYLYFIGSYISKYISANSINLNRKKYFGRYIICGVLFGTISILEAYEKQIGISIPWRPFIYNNPILLLISIYFFLFILSFHFKSKAINWISDSILGVYMLNELVIRYDFLKPFSHHYKPITELLLWFGVSIAFFVFAIGFDKIRIMLFKPFWILYDKYFKSYIQQIKNSIKRIVIISEQKHHLNP